MMDREKFLLLKMKKKEQPFIHLDTMMLTSERKITKFFLPKRFSSLEHSDLYQY